MSEPEEEEPDPVTIEITVDTGPFVEAMYRLQATLMFAFHPDLRDAGSGRPGEEPGHDEGPAQ